jgi:hypothetical protein
LNFPDFDVRESATAFAGNRQAAAYALQLSETFGIYQCCAAMTAVYPGAFAGGVLYPAFGLVDEACEVAASVRVVYENGPLPADPKAQASRLIARAALWSADYLGRIFGLLKKCHRDADGAMDAERQRNICGLIESLRHELSRLDAAVRAADRFVLPPLEITGPDRIGIAMELGDTFYYVAQACTEVRLRLADVAVANNEKLFDRAARGTLHGSGDHR